MNQNIFYYLLIFLSVFTACKSKDNSIPAPQERIIPVSVAEVSEEMVSNIVNYPATVVALNETELRAEVSGYITGIFVTDGAQVSKGQKLYEIDRIRYQAVRDQAKANLQIALTNLDKVKKDLDRYIMLDEKQAIAKQIVDYAQFDYNNAKAQVDGAKANLLNAETNLSRSIIYAPFSGTIGISQVRNGALVSAGVTLLNTVSSTQPIAVDFMVSEKDIQQFLDFKQQSNIQRDSIISLGLPNGQVYSHFGKIITIDRAVDQNTGTITVRAVFDNSKGELRVGMNVDIRILNKITTPKIVIPYKSTMEQLGQTMVYVVSDSNTALPYMVKLGFKIGDKVVVNEGLSVGQKIIIDGLMNLRPNDKITIDTASK
ncbi:MAG: efflux RND transporter periplasmic adaptor subunit [Chitinophagales bacterium]|nr:efflux RND transporter periplasmic adaptor subunit [Chitinophagales bacterium]MCZ2394783.1 efflux RND transporter periplasmic adaptor subunit [Chitinophagales bacterium]